MGVERTIAMLQRRRSVYETELFAPIIESISQKSGKRMDESAETAMAFRVVADHMRSSVFVLGDEQGIAPSNVGQGYVLRRLIRRAVRYAKQLRLEPGFSGAISATIIDGYRHVYPELDQNRTHITRELVQEEERFETTLTKGMTELDKVLSKLVEHKQTQLPGRVAFKLYDTCGFPLEFTEEICAERGLAVDREGFDTAFEKHKAVSKQSAEKAFKGGLADHSEATTQLHTATHLLHKALQMVLGDHVKQKGSNITEARLRFDFSHPDKMRDEDLLRVENIVNEVIAKDHPVTVETMTIEQARDAGATALFSGKYGEQVKVYTMGDFSKEVCGGPHVSRTGELGRFKITKEGSSSAGIRRIRAELQA